MPDMDKILHWETETNNQVDTIDAIMEDLNKIFGDYMSGPYVSWEISYNVLRAGINTNIERYQKLIEVYNARIVYLAQFYDNALKTSTIVTENYEKLEECTELIRNELKDMVKKLCSFTTLEMDYYDKLLSAWSKSESKSESESESTFHEDYKAYRARLQLIHREDQIKLFYSNLTVMNSTIGHMMNKQLSMLRNKENIAEITKLWTKESRYSY